MLKVLLVDDEPFILQGIKVIIDWEKEGFEIAATAENGLEALEYLKKEKVDLIIADIRMPGTAVVAAHAALTDTAEWHIARCKMNDCVIDTAAAKTAGI